MRSSPAPSARLADERDRGDSSAHGLYDAKLDHQSMVGRHRWTIGDNRDGSQYQQEVTYRLSSKIVASEILRGP